jgi:hypothetical protein
VAPESAVRFRTYPQDVQVLLQTMVWVAKAQ